MKDLLTASRMSTLLGCPRRHFWRYEVGLKTLTEATALRIGSAWHRAMEARWQGLPFEAALGQAVEGMSFEEIQVATMSGLLAGYYRRYEQEIVKELHAEVEFRHPIEGSRTFDSAGKIDGLGVLHDGRLALVEHKTTSESVDSGSDYWLRLRLNQQVMQYVVAARALGWDVGLILYDVTKKPATYVNEGGGYEHARVTWYRTHQGQPVATNSIEVVQTAVVGQSILSVPGMRIGGDLDLTGRASLSNFVQAVIDAQ